MIVVVNCCGVNGMIHLVTCCNGKTIPSGGNSNSASSQDAILFCFLHILHSLHSLW